MNTIKKLSLFILFLLILTGGKTFAQVELVGIEDNIYSFLDRMFNKNIITDYNPAAIPISKAEAMKLLVQIKEKETKLTSTDKSILKKYFIEYNIEDKSENEISFFSKQKFLYIFNNEKQK